MCAYMHINIHIYIHIYTRVYMHYIAVLDYMHCSDHSSHEYMQNQLSNAQILVAKYTIDNADQCIHSSLSTIRSRYCVVLCGVELCCIVLCCIVFCCGVVLVCIILISECIVGRQ
jgi:hypothetical protein